MLEDDDQKGVQARLESFKKNCDDKKRKRDEWTKREFDAKSHRRTTLMEISPSQSTRMVV